MMANATLLEISRWTPEQVDSTDRVAKEMRRISLEMSRSASASSNVPSGQSAFLATSNTLAQHSNQLTFASDYGRDLLRNDRGTLNKIAFSWIASTIELVDQKSNQRTAIGDVFTVEQADRPGRKAPRISIEKENADSFAAWFFDRRDEEIATIQLRRESFSEEEQELKMTDFLLQDVHETRQEKYQITETFGRAFLFLYGARQEIYTFSGTLVDSKNLNWRAQLIDKYRRELRASKSIERGLKARVAYRGSMREGYILGLDLSLSQSDLHLARFSMTMFVTDQQELFFSSSQAFTDADAQENIGDTERPQLIVRADEIPLRVVQEIITKAINEDNTIKQESGVFKFPKEFEGGIIVS